MKIFYSNCCGVELDEPESEIDVCPNCNKVCEAISEEELATGSKEESHHS